MKKIIFQNAITVSVLSTFLCGGFLNAQDENLLPEPSNNQDSLHGDLPEKLPQSVLQSIEAAAPASETSIDCQSYALEVLNPVYLSNDAPLRNFKAWYANESHFAYAYIESAMKAVLSFQEDLMSPNNAEDKIEELCNDGEMLKTMQLQQKYLQFMNDHIRIKIRILEGKKHLSDEESTQLQELKEASQKLELAIQNMDQGIETLKSDPSYESFEGYFTHIALKTLREENEDESASVTPNNLKNNFYNLPTKKYDSDYFHSALQRMLSELNYDLEQDEKGGDSGTSDSGEMDDRSSDPDLGGGGSDGGDSAADDPSSANTDSDVNGGSGESAALQALKDRMIENGIMGYNTFKKTPFSIYSRAIPSEGDSEAGTNSAPLGETLHYRSPKTRYLERSQQHLELIERLIELESEMEAEQREREENNNQRTTPNSFSRELRTRRGSLRFFQRMSPLLRNKINNNEGDGGSSGGAADSNNSAESSNNGGTGSVGDTSDASSNQEGITNSIYQALPPAAQGGAPSNVYNSPQSLPPTAQGGTPSNTYNNQNSGNSGRE